MCRKQAHDENIFQYVRISAQVEAPICHAKMRNAGTLEKCFLDREVFFGRSGIVRIPAQAVIGFLKGLLAKSTTGIEAGC